VKVLIGNTGLIGKTLKDNIKFELEFNSSNIESINNYNLNMSDLYLSCLPATKWIANKDPIKDYNNILSIYNTISNYTFNKIILFSTIDIYHQSPLLKNEDFNPKIKEMNYGSNRLIFELLVKNLNYKNIQIFRLPSLFGHRIKKNILFDLLNNNEIEKINFNSKYQWLNLKNLYKIMKQSDHLHGIINLFPEPLDSIELLKLFSIDKNKINFQENKTMYDFRTKYATSGYIESKAKVINEIKDFVYEYRNQSTSIQ
jgi:hypothetical protein